MSNSSKKVRARMVALAKVRRSLGWTREHWIDEAQSVLGRALIVWVELRLAHRNGHRRLVRGMTAEFERSLATGTINLLLHPVRREFDRAVAFEEAIGGMGPMAESLRQYVERRWVLGYGAVRTGIDQGDVEEFWRKAREAGELLGRKNRTLLGST